MMEAHEPMTCPTSEIWRTQYTQRGPSLSNRTAHLVATPIMEVPLKKSNIKIGLYFLKVNEAIINNNYLVRIHQFHVGEDNQQKGIQLH